MTTIPEVAAVLQTVLSTTADEIARESGWMQRQTKLSGARFIQTLVFGWLATPDASLEALAQTAAALGVTVSPQAIDQRFTPEAAACLEEVLAEAVTALVTAEPVVVPLLARFNGVYIQDSTSLSLPDALAEHWPGCGGRTPGAGQASLKLQVRLELRSGALGGPFPEAGRAQDRASGLQHAPLPPGALRIADLGYFSLTVLQDLDADGVYWLSRYQVQTAVFDAGGRRWTVPDLLRRQGATADRSITLGAAHRLPARLLAARVPPAVAATRRRQLREEAKREGKTPSAAKLALCDWTVLVTNVPPELLSVEEALVLARARWQIELLFKLWKSHGQVDVSRSAKPWRILCEVYAKLLAMVVQHWLVLVSCWRFPDRSLVKAAQTIRKYAPMLAAGFAGPALLQAALATIQRCLASGCRVAKRRAKPATHQLFHTVTATTLITGPDHTGPDHAALACAEHDRAA